MTASTRPSSQEPAARAGLWPDNPPLVRLWRGDHVESQHRGAWVLADGAGRALEGAGAFDHPVYARSSVKALQALPLLESGAAERFELGDDELALAVASHAGEPQHTERVAALLARLGLSERDLQCGPQPPGDTSARAELERRGEPPGPLHNNCSGKHAGFLALALHLGVDPARYLDPESASQRLVRRAVEETSGVRPGELTAALDGCSAPTFRLPLVRLAQGLARFGDPRDLAPGRRAACERITRAVAAWPELLAGSRGRLCTDLVRASGGRLFPKIGGEAVYAVGLVDRGRGLAVKIDDGGARALGAVVVELLERLGFLAPDELAALGHWRAGAARNWAGLTVGRLEVLA